MTLAETYACAAAVPLATPSMADTFFPLDHPVEKAILIHAFAGATVNQNGQILAAFPGKLYSHFGEVIRLLRPIAEAAGYRIYQIGGPGEPSLPGIESLVGKTTIHQCAYLVKRCALLVGNDSIWAHVRGAEKRAQVHIYGSTSAPHFPQWRDEQNSVLIESHRGGRPPSYSAQESPKTIDFIPPEQVVNAAISLLSLGKPVTRQSLYFGESYYTHALELVPNVIVDPRLQLPASLVVRMDYVPASDTEAAESSLVSNLRTRKCLIVTDRELNLNLLTQLKGNVAAVRVEVDNVSAEWIKGLKRLGIQTAFFSSERDPEKLARRRLDMYDACLFDHFVPPTREDFVKGAGLYHNKTLDSMAITDRLEFSTNKFILSDSKVYLSKAHWLAGKATPSTDQNSGSIIDSEAFWEDLAHWYIHSPL